MLQRPTGELDVIVRRGARVSRPGFTIYYGSLRSPLPARIVMGAKAEKRAVVRNLWRRRTKAILNKFQLRRTGIVIVLRREILTQTYAAYKDLLTAQLSKILKA